MTGRMGGCIRSLILILFIESELLYKEFSASCVILKFNIKSAPYIIKLYLAGNWKSWLERPLFEAFEKFKRPLFEAF